MHYSGILADASSNVFFHIFSIEYIVFTLITIRYRGAEFLTLNVNRRLIKLDSRILFGEFFGTET